MRTIDDKRFASCGNDNQIKIWDTKTYELIHSMNKVFIKPGKNLLGIYPLKYNNNLLSLTEECCIGMFSLKTYQCECAIVCKDAYYYFTNSIIELEDYFVVSNLLIDKKNYLSTKICENEVLAVLELRDGNLICGTSGHNLIIYNPRKKIICNELNSYSFYGIVSMVKKAENTLIMSSYSKNISIIEI